jgi:hypothetical protein
MVKGDVICSNCDYVYYWWPGDNLGCPNCGHRLVRVMTEGEIAYHARHAQGLLNKQIYYGDITRVEDTFRRLRTRG